MAKADAINAIFSSLVLGAITKPGVVLTKESQTWVQLKVRENVTQLLAKWAMNGSLKP